MNIVGAKIRNLRIQKGYSQECLAFEMGISQPTYARLEQEDTRINITRLLQISNLLGVSVLMLLDQDSEKIISHLATTETSMSLIHTQNTYSNFDNDHIITLKEEIVFLRGILEKISTGKKSFWL